MIQESVKLKEYKNEFLEPYYFTITSNKHYIYRYFNNYIRLQQFLDNGIYMSSACSFSDGLECADIETIVKVKELHNSQELWQEHNYHVSPTYLEDYKKNAYNNLKRISAGVNETQKGYSISCWYLPDGEHENELMWRSYTDCNRFGYLVKIKIKDFLDHLLRSTHLNEDKGKVVYGIVRYYDYNKSENIQRLKYKAFRKHKSYSDERELRLVIKKESSLFKDGFYLRMNKDFYTDISIYMHPQASYEEYLDQRSKIISKYKTELHQSELSVAYNLRKYY